MSVAFLTARWSNLLLATYAVPPQLLRPRLPRGLELDWRDGQTFVSLVAFDFLDTRVFGIPWPGYRNFSEVNLRFYVRKGTQRGVVFIREFVPARLIAWVARTLYNEPYLATPLSSEAFEDCDRLKVEYRLQWDGKNHVISATGAKPAFRPEETSTAHFFKEHHWGYGTSRRGYTTGYQVRHPPWETYPIISFRVDLDWERVYGPEWAFLQNAKPSSTVLAAGSEVAVFPKGNLAAQ